MHTVTVQNRDLRRCTETESSESLLPIVPFFPFFIVSLFLEDERGLEGTLRAGSTLPHHGKVVSCMRAYERQDGK